MGIFFVAISIFSFFQCSLCQKCPAIYLRYSKEHSFCKPPSSTCPVFHSGVTDAEALQILDQHNKMRSKVAMGKETSAGGLPQAADMMQMVWDKELATVAQRRVEQCIYEHDCNNCRQVENFAVGQNIAYREMMCYGSRKCPLNAVPDWTDVIKMFYDEVAIFDKKYVKSMVFESGKVYGHFTQMVWSYSWRIGCGFVAFQKGNGYRQLYVCNYGPGGNIVNQPMYETGPPCSSCPTNSCCGRSCARADYDGLCRMNNIKEAPIYTPKENYFFYCDFSVTTGDCSASATEPNRWRYIKALGGSFAEIVLNGGESSTLQLKTPIRPKRNFCFVAKYRSGPTMDGQTSSNSAVVIYEMSNSRPVTMNLPQTADSQQYFEYSMSLAWSDDTKVSFKFSVPTGASAQFFNIQLLTAKRGRCNTR